MKARLIKEMADEKNSSYNIINYNKNLYLDRSIINFQMPICNIEVNLETMKCEIEFNLIEWDSKRQALRDIKYFVEGENDLLSFDIEEQLSNIGIELVYPGLFIEEETVEFDIKHI